MEKTEIAALIQKARAGDKAAMTQLLEIAHGSVIFQCRPFSNSSLYLLADCDKIQSLYSAQGGYP